VPIEPAADPQQTPGVSIGHAILYLDRNKISACQSTEERMRLNNKVALITGGNQGIGRATVDLFAKEGARVIALDRVEPGESYGSGIEYIRLDVTKEEDWKHAVDVVLSRHGRIDVLVNNAGILTYEPIHESTLESWNTTIAVNQTGPFLGMKHVIPAMRRQKQGSIVNVSSIWGTIGAPGAAAYHASKGAVRTMTKNAALTYVADGIRCNSVHPGISDTPMVAAQSKQLNDLVISGTPMKRLGRPIELAYAILYLASDEASYTTGAELYVDGGFLAM
jgi:NAD(P)-dependent dehydrogenase (short-subunit alcohol dehydrogenase family)